MSSPVDHDLIRELAALLEETGLTEIQVETGDLKLRVSRQGSAVAAAAPAPAVTASAPGQPQAAPATDHPGTVPSPMVGVAYLAAEPGTPPFVAVGDAVTQGQTLLIIEAMKTMNPILAPRDGTVTRLLIKNGEPVEYGDPLLIIE